MRKSVSSWIVAGIVLSGCHKGADQTDGDVVYAATSPDRGVQAQLVKEGFGATVPEVSSVRLQAGKRDASEVFRADHVKGL